MVCRRESGISLIEILVAASLFTIVILGISQSVLLLHRYSRATLCKYKAHLIATSYFESLLCDTHPYDLNKNVVSLRRIDVPEETFIFKFDKNDYAQLDDAYVHLNVFEESIYGSDGALKIYMLLKVEESPLCQVYKIDASKPDSAENSKARIDINPPEGFQSLRLKYWYTSPFMNSAAHTETEASIAYLDNLEHDELYAIRPLLPDDPEYDI